MTKGFSIITNFGCDTGCSYCIWNKHPLKNIKTSYSSTDWQYLYYYLKKNKILKISVSGGGDPFYKLDENLPYWSKLFKICQKLNILIDVHTSKFLDNNEFLKLFNKIVIHLNPKRFIENKNRILNIPIKKRIVFVLNTEVDLKFIEDINLFCEENKIELSFRELFGEKINAKTNFVQNFIISNEDLKGYKFIKQGDYNLYFMPNNEIVEKFIEEL